MASRRVPRFVKGKSGNPRGRPRTPKPEPVIDNFDPALEIAKNHFETPIRVIEEGQSVQISRMQAYLKMPEKQAAAGEVRAAQELIRLHKEADAWKAQRDAEEEAERRKRVEMGTRYKEAYPNLIKNGKPPEEWMPHPEDIIIKPGRSVEFNGACSRERYEDLKRLKVVRDVALFQQLRMAWGPVFDTDRWILSISLELIVRHFDPLFPLRWRRDDPRVADWYDNLRRRGPYSIEAARTEYFAKPEHSRAARVRFKAFPDELWDKMGIGAANVRAHIADAMARTRSGKTRTRTDGAVGKDRRELERQ